MRLGLLLPIFALCGCSSLATLDVADIPPRFDHPYAGTLFVITLPLNWRGCPADASGCRTVADFCANSVDLRFGEVAAACEMNWDAPGDPKHSTAFITLPRWKDVGTDELVRLIRIETAKANGWSVEIRKQLR